MAFGDFSSLEIAAKRFQIRLERRKFLDILPQAPTPALVDQLRFARECIGFGASEGARREFVIAPVLLAAYRPFAASLTLWCEMSLSAEEPLSGVPDYFFCRRSELGLVRDRPYVIVMEAKKDDFERGWGQCLAGMLAAQRLNQSSRPIYGCVTNGDVWEFGRLADQVFTLDPAILAIERLEDLLGAWSWVFTEAQAEALRPAA